MKLPALLQNTGADLPDMCFMCRFGLAAGGDASDLT